MEGSSLDQSHSPVIETRRFVGNAQQAGLSVEELTTISRAALGQFTVQRLMAYGLTHADAMELRGRVGSGEDWQTAAISIADDLRATLTGNSLPLSRANVLYRASALMRMAQVMMIEDTEERQLIFDHASRYFADAARLAGDAVRKEVLTSYGALLAWVYRPHTDPVGVAIVIGGIEGWAMDFAEMSRWLAQRGVETWAVDGPGQGESRFRHGHYLHPHWRDVYKELVNHIKQCGMAMPLAVIGSSVGGTLAFEIAANDPRISLCVSDGGTVSGSTVLGKQEATVPKKQMMCGPNFDAEEADAIWSDIDVRKVGANLACPVLIIHGQRDPLICDEEMQEIFSCLASVDKQMIRFSDGDHCVYNHADDKHIAIADWVAIKLRQVDKAGMSATVSA